MTALLARLYGAIPTSLKRFVVTGLSAVLIDAAVYTLLLKFAVAVNIAKGVAFASGALFAYFANRFWTFGATRTAQTRALGFIALYLGSAALNVAVNHALLALLGAHALAYPAAWFVATGASATLNYLGMRYVVFRGRDQGAAD